MIKFFVCLQETLLSCNERKKEKKGIIKIKLNKAIMNGKIKRE